MRSCSTVKTAFAILATLTLCTGRAHAAGSAARAQASAVGNAFAEVADEVAPSVVAVSTLQDESSIQPGLSNRPGERTPASLLQVNGSGLVVDARGDIVTESSMITGANRVIVTLPDGHSVDARVIGNDAGSGLAVIRVAGVHLAPARLGDARRMRNGQWLVAVGRAAHEHTVSAGVLVSKESTHLIGTRVEPYLETDALVVPQNLGGALANLDGEVVGVCLVSEGRGVLGRAVPSWRVQRAVDAITRGARLGSRARTIR